MILKHHIILALLLGFLIDCIAGDPRWFPHPVKGIGKLIVFLESRLRNAEDMPKKQIRKGFLLVSIVIVVSAGAAFVILAGAYLLHPVFGLVMESVLDACMIAAKDLKQEAMEVCRALKEGDTERARRAVSKIVGRDTETLDEPGITRAAVETVAENTSDGVIAPVFYLAVGGPVLGAVYKAVNTMDSMIGYKNETYLYFGKAAARLDDILNYLPAWITALLMTVVSFLGFDGRGAYRIFIRDHKKHASPNAGKPESVMAGALGVQLAGDASYGGVIFHKETIGDALRPIEADDIRRACELMYGTVLAFLTACIVCRMLI